MRGTRQASRSPWSQTGIIPAHAGNTDRTRSMCFEYRDHPRVCGEHSRMRSSRKHITGSSPRMRGNTQHFNQFHVLVEDHPRVCGEHSVTVYDQDGKPGSSPRMRGTRRPAPTRRSRSGIIPAYAGNTSGLRRGCTPRWDHPRVCGEHSCVENVARCTSGSSPRMRGTHVVACWCECRRGIIPAYAGNTRRIPTQVR